MPTVANRARIWLKTRIAAPFYHNLTLSLSIPLARKPNFGLAHGQMRSLPSLPLVDYLDKPKLIQKRIVAHV